MQCSGRLVSVIIPMFNEEPTIGDVIERTKKVLNGLNLYYEIIVVDDFSNDNSVNVAKLQNVKIYRLNMHMGKGFALRAGFAHSKGDLIATIDSDGSHRPEELIFLLNPVLNGKADLVIGSRFSNGKSVHTKKLNEAGNKLFNYIIQFLIRAPISDSQSGFRVMTRPVLQSMNLRSGEYEIESEMLVKTARKNFRILEVPISFEQRTYGTSQIDPLIDGIKILVSTVLAYLRI